MIKRIFPLLFFSVITASIISPLVADNETNFQLRKSIADERKRIEELKKSVVSLAESREDFSKTHKERLVSRNDDIRKIMGEMTAQGTELRTEQALLSQERGKQKNYELQFEMFKSSVKGSIQNYLLSVKNGFPFRLDERSAALDRLLSEADIESIRAEELFNRLTTILYKDVNSGFDSEVYTEDGFKVLRIGHLLLAASSGEGGTVKILDLNSGNWTWREDCGITERKAIRDAIDMVEGKKTPALSDFPIPVSLIRNSLKGDIR